MNKYGITKEQVTLADGSVLDFILDRGKRKNMYLCIRDGQVILRIPVWEPKDKALEFLRSKTDWIKKNVSREKPEHGFQSYEDGEQISLLGKVYTLRLVQSNVFSEPYFSESEIVVYVSEDMPKERIKLLVDRLIGDFTKKSVSEVFERLCEVTGLYPNKVTIKKLKSRWGSCSSGGNISINSDMIYHDAECLEYVVIHELCHLRHMDHSAEFWALVERYCPDRKRIRKKLR